MHNKPGKIKKTNKKMKTIHTATVCLKQ